MFQYKCCTGCVNNGEPRTQTFVMATVYLLWWVTRSHAPSPAVFLNIQRRVNLVYLFFPTCTHFPSMPLTGRGYKCPMSLLQGYPACSWWRPDTFTLHNAPPCAPAPPSHPLPFTPPLKVGGGDNSQYYCLDGHHCTDLHVLLSGVWGGKLRTPALLLRNTGEPWHCDK